VTGVVSQAQLRRPLAWKQRFQKRSRFLLLRFLSDVLFRQAAADERSPDYWEVRSTAFELVDSVQYFPQELSSQAVLEAQPAVAGYSLGSAVVVDLLLSTLGPKPFLES
jgi:hypothetical protein